MLCHSAIPHILQSINTAKNSTLKSSIYNPPLQKNQTRTHNLNLSTNKQSIKSKTQQTSKQSINNQSNSTMEGVIFKWTNLFLGWQRRWVAFEGGYVIYARPLSWHERKMRLLNGQPIRLSTDRSVWINAGAGQPALKIVFVKVTGFRASRSDGLKFHVKSSRKSLKFRAYSVLDRRVWINALARATGRNGPFEFGLLRAHLIAIGLDEGLVEDCERIVQREFGKGLEQVGSGTEREGAGLKVGEASKAEADSNERQEAAVQNGEALQRSPPAIEVGDSSIIRGIDVTGTSEEIELPFLDATDFLSEPSQETDLQFFDALTDGISDQSAPANQTSPAGQTSPASQTSPAGQTSAGQTGPGGQISAGQTSSDGQTSAGQTGSGGQISAGQTSSGGQAGPSNQVPPGVQRRSKLPDPREKAKEVSLWSVLKDSVGKETKNIDLPITFHEPISSLQKWCEEFEYSHLLDEAHEAGKTGDNLMRAMKVAAFAVASYASYDGRSCKPFNPLLGETYEADFPEKGIRFIAEKVSRKPLTMACHCEGKGWRFWGDNSLKSKFRGQSIHLYPTGNLFLQFDDGEIFTWAKVNTSINNLILGSPHCNLYGTMAIKGNREFSCILKFKDSSLLDRMPRKVQGSVTDPAGNEIASLKGEWNESLFYEVSKPRNEKEGLSEGEFLLWKKNESPAELSRYNFSSFGVTLNELTADLEGKIAPTDSRLRPDQRHLENGEYDRATVEKLRLEEKQRLAKELEQNWKPRWFEQQGGSYVYTGGYWKARELNDWSTCPNLY